MTDLTTAVPNRQRRLRADGTWGNVEDIVDSALCMGCGVCEPVCPVQCIQIGESTVNGQLIPLVDQTTCVAGCDVCMRVCPGDEVDFAGLNREFLGCEPARPEVGVVERTYVGHAVNHEIRYAASSGGAVTALLLYLKQQDIIDGAIVLRMNPARPYEAEVVVARTSEEIIAAKGSKYCPAKSGVGLRAVMRQPGRYAFVGLPCHVHGVRKFQRVFRKYRSRIVITLGLFCGGGITMQGTRFLLKQMSVSESDVAELRIRGDGWPGRTTAVCQDGRVATLNKLSGAKSRTEAAAYTSWMHRYFFPPRCLTCTDLTAQLADISFGDPWLKRYTTTDKIGLSMMVVRSAIGQRLLDLAVRGGSISIVDEMTIDEIVQSQGKIAKKIRTRPYRVAARLLGLKTPDYGDLYQEGSVAPQAVAGALWEYLRLWLGRHERLWPALVRLELGVQWSREFRVRWGNRIRRRIDRHRKRLGIGTSPTDAGAPAPLD